MSDPATTAPTRARWQVWTSVVVATVMCVGLGLYLTVDRNSSHTSSDLYHAYAGHRWYLQLPTSSPGYIELGDDGVFTTLDTEVEFFGTYRITGAGELIARWTGGISTGTPNFDQTVVDALAPLNDFAKKINVDKTMKIRPISGTSFSLDVEGHILTFAERPDTPSSIPASFPPLVGPAALSYTQQSGACCTDHTTSGAAWAENLSWVLEFPRARPAVLGIHVAVL